MGYSPKLHRDFARHNTSWPRGSEQHCEGEVSLVADLGMQIKNFTLDSTHLTEGPIPITTSNDTSSSTAGTDIEVFLAS